MLGRIFRRNVGLGRRAISVGKNHFKRNVVWNTFWGMGNAFQTATIVPKPHFFSFLFFVYQVPATVRFVQTQVIQFIFISLFETKLNFILMTKLLFWTPLSSIFIYFHQFLHQKHKQSRLNKQAVQATEHDVVTFPPNNYTKGLNVTFSYFFYVQTFLYTHFVVKSL